jgi:two-component system, NarL family, invasion response regulator UvrY
MQNVLICDDHSIVRRGLKNIIASNFCNYNVEETCNISGALSHLHTQKPKFAIFDLQLADGNMLEYISNITTLYPQLNILIYSMCNEDIYAKRVLQMGAKGFLTKNADEEEIVRALRFFLVGENYLSNRLNNILINSLRDKKTENLVNPFIQLSNREIEVTRHLLSGKSLKEISNQMRLHANTIVTYKNRVFEKFSINNIIELTNMARIYHFA